MKLTASAVGIYVLKTHGPGHSGLCMVITRDMKQLISVRSLAIILAVMAAVGNNLSSTLNFHLLKLQQINKCH